MKRVFTFSQQGRLRLGWAFGFVVALLAGCGSQKTEWTDAKGNRTEIIAHTGDKLRIDKIDTDFSFRKDGCREGVLLKIKFKSRPQIKNSTQNPAPSYQQMMRLSLPNNETVGIRSYEADTAKKPLKWIRALTDGQIFIPYAEMNLPAGAQTVLLDVWAGLAVTPAELITNPKSEHLTLRLSFNQPPVQGYSLRVRSFYLDPKLFDPMASDFRVLGPGYPDPYYMVRIDGAFHYASDHKTNELRREFDEFTPPFYLAPADSFYFAVYDHDDIPNHDFLAGRYFSSQSVSKNENQPSEFRFDMVNPLVMSLETQERYWQRRDSALKRREAALKRLAQ